MPFIILLSIVLSVAGGIYAAETDEQPIPSIDDTANEHVTNDWAGKLVLNFRKKSENWTIIQTADGVLKVLGKPLSQDVATSNYRSRGALVAKVWHYQKDGKWEKGETYEVVIGFDSEGKTLYCATIANHNIP